MIGLTRKHPIQRASEKEKRLGDAAPNVSHLELAFTERNDETAKDKRSLDSELQRAQSQLHSPSMNCEASNLIAPIKAGVTPFLMSQPPKNRRLPTSCGQSDNSMNPRYRERRPRLERSPASPSKAMLIVPGSGISVTLASSK